MHNAMKTQVSTTLVFLALGLLATSCDKVSDVPMSNDKINFSAQNALVVQTTKSATAVTELGSFYVSAVTGIADDAEAFTNVTFTKAPGTDIYTSARCWPSTDQSFRFYASNAPLSYSAAGATVTVADTDLDVVCAYLPTSTYAAVNTLVFQHIFARISTVTIQAQGSAVDHISVEVWDARTGGIYNLKTGYGHVDGTGWTPAENPIQTGTQIYTNDGTVAVGATHTGADADLWLVPGSYYFRASWHDASGATHNTMTAAAVTIPAGKVNALQFVIEGNNLGIVPESIGWASDLSPEDSGWYDDVYNGDQMGWDPGTNPENAGWDNDVDNNDQLSWAPGANPENAGWDNDVNNGDQMGWDPGAKPENAGWGTDGGSQDQMGWAPGTNPEGTGWGNDGGMEPVAWHSFSVAATTQVVFSPGNLQAMISAEPASHGCRFAQGWRFAPHQYDIIGDAPGNTTFAQNDYVDLFAWVGEGAIYDSFGLTTVSTDDENHFGNSASGTLRTDWGSVQKLIRDIGAGWRTLTAAEWAYLFNTRASGAEVNGVKNARFARATLTVGSGTVNGIVLFPDGYAGGTPAGVVWHDAVNAASTGGWENAATVSAAGWAALETKGCIFLPAAGYRSDTDVFGPDTYGCYWSASAADLQNAYGLEFGGAGLDPGVASSRYFGLSVRLVKEL